MTPTQSFEARAALAGLAAVFSAALPAVRRFYLGSAARFNRLLLLAFAASRFGLFTLVFLVLRIQLRGDIPAYYVYEAQAARFGLLPYRGFATSYAPLHPYLDSVAISIWPNALAIVLLAILFECLLVFTWLRVAPSLTTENTRRTAALLYLASPLSLQFVTIDGQDNVILALAFALVLLLLIRSRAALSGAVLGFSIALVKFLPLLWVPPVFLALRTRWRWLAGFAVAAFLGYGFFAWKGIDLLFPIKVEGSLTTASNLPYFVDLLFDRLLAPRLFDLLFLLCFLAACLFVLQLTRRAGPPARLQLVLWAVPFVTILLVLLSKKSWPNYFMLILFPLCLLPALRSTASRLFFIFFEFLATTVHSAWSSLLSQADAVELHTRIAAHQPVAIFVGITQALIVAAYLWLLALLARQLRLAGQHPG